MVGAPASVAALLVDVAEVSRLQGRLGFEASADLFDSLARHFAEALGARGEVHRFGDGRFVVLVRDVRNRGHAVLAAEKLLRAAEQALSRSAVTIKPLMPVGVALYPLQAQCPEDLLRNAQLGAATARHRGERIHVFDHLSAAQVLRPWELGEAFAEALETGELAVFYQPKIRIADGRVAGAEALLRWERAGETVAPPDVFIALAEESGLIHDTTWYGLTNSLRLSASCDGLNVAVNITPGMLHHREFVEMIRSAVTTWHVPEGGLTLEVTEGAVIADFEQSAARLKKVRDMGVRIALDDFGTGYSSLSYFKKIPANELKIDKSFILRMQHDAADQHLVGTILSLCRHFHLDVVAEGVEDAPTLEMLKGMGCDYAQGFLFSRALDRDPFIDWWRSYPDG